MLVPADLVLSTPQEQAVEAPIGPVLVVAGPGAGKTLCLIERIRFLLGKGAAPERICAVTFTNKAAEEIGLRLRDALGAEGRDVHRGTLHALCLEILRDAASEAGLDPGFGVVDEPYQRAVLRRLGVHRKDLGRLLLLFGRCRLEGLQLGDQEREVFLRYRAALRAKHVLDFDDLIAEAAALLDRDAAVARRWADRWDHLLVDEFQDLDRTQYAVLVALARHRSVFAVGDDEQSIFAWRGAEPAILRRFATEFGIDRPIILDRNRRCSRAIFDAARRLIGRNTSLFDKVIEAERDSPYAVEAYAFDDEHAEAAWLVADLCADYAEAGGHWGDRALLYRKHTVGSLLEQQLIRQGIPCRLPRGKALKDDPAIGYVIDSLRVMVAPDDPAAVDAFADRVLPRDLLDQARARADREGQALLEALRAFAEQRGRHDPDRRKAWRFIYHVENLAALRQSHATVEPLIEELLSQRVGKYRNPLEDHWEQLSDPEEFPGAVALAEGLRRVTEDGARIWILPSGGRQIPLRRMLLDAGLRVPIRVRTADARPGAADLVIDAGTPGVGLTVFKALQHAVGADLTTGFNEYVCFDLETTDLERDQCEIVEIGAVRVRDGTIVDRFHSLVRPTRPISTGASEVHGYRDDDLVEAPAFAEIWPGFRAFVGADIVVAHNAQQFDVPVLRRMAAGLPGITSLAFFDTLPLAKSLFAESARLEMLAQRFGIKTGRAHHALDDAETLAHVVARLHHTKATRARRTALVNLLDDLGLALALEHRGKDPGGEAGLLATAAVPYLLGRYSDALSVYVAERSIDPEGAPSVEDVITWCGGRETMARIRATRSAKDRYPSAMARLQALIEGLAGETLDERLRAIIARVALSTSEGIAADPNRVQLLTLHATKGLEFSRVYIVGVEDSQLPGYREIEHRRTAEIEEARRLLYVGMTRARDRLVLTRVARRGDWPTGGGMFLEEIGLLARPPAGPAVRDPAARSSP